jgi:hypothetical protein
MDRRLCFARRLPSTDWTGVDRFTAAIQAPEVKSKLIVQGLYIVEMCGAKFATFLRKQYGRPDWRRMQNFLLT